jgi:hypothetical protein
MQCPIRPEQTLKRPLTVEPFHFGIFYLPFHFGAFVGLSIKSLILTFSQRAFPTTNSSHHQQQQQQSTTMLITDENEPTMGIKSQQRSPGKKMMKHRRGKMNSFFQPSQAASMQKPSVLNGTKVCKGCTHHSSVYKHGHDLTCPKSDYFGMTLKQKSDAIKEKKRMQALKKPPLSEAPNRVAWGSTSLGQGFFRQQSTGTTVSVPAAVGVILSPSPPTTSTSLIMSL